MLTANKKTLKPRMWVAKKRLYDIDRTKEVEQKPRRSKQINATMPQRMESSASFSWIMASTVHL